MTPGAAQPYQLGAAEAALAIREGRLTAEELVVSCLDRIEAQEGQIGAWAFVDRQLALQAARDADLTRRAGKPLGALHGVPVGVKDIFDTADLPTEDGTPLHAGRTPAYDASAVAALRCAGAIVLGKTVTAELAVCTPGRTRNPHDPQRTPGGSSSGSAAAVAAHMVPLAIGTQTNGSVIRPASYCGVVGYKPSFGLISRYRVLRASRSLDQVGVFARSIADAALLAEQLMGFDRHDRDTRMRARPDLVGFATQTPPLPPRLALVRTPAWPQADAAAQAAFAALAEYLGGAVSVVDLDDLLGAAVDWHRTIMEAELARNYRRELERGGAQLSPALRAILERGRTITAGDYLAALEQVPALVSGLEQVLLEYDAILTPAASGEAPLGLESTGNPVFCTPWTLCGMPAISLPLLQGAAGMPLGAQLVAARDDDARLLRTANWLASQVAQA